MTVVRQVGGAGIRRRPTERRGRAVLDLDAIVEAALAEISTGGREALSISGVARRLEVSPRAIYHYVASRRDLVQAVLVRVQQDLPLPVSTGDWRHDLRAYRDGLFAYMDTHAVVLEITETEQVFALSDRYHQVVERALEVFVDIGLTPHDAMLAYGEFARWVGAAHRYGRPATLFEDVVDSGHTASVEHAETRPLTAAAGVVDADEQLEFGFDRLLDSFAALADRLS